MKTLLHLAAIAACATLFIAPASAGVLYDNTNFYENQFEVDAFQFNSGFATANSFSLNANSTLNTIDIWVWETAPASGLHVDDLTSVDWFVQYDNGSTNYPFDGGFAGFGTGTAGSSMTGTFVKAISLPGDGGPEVFDIYEEAIMVPDLLLYANQTYWLTLNAGVTTDGKPVYWDQSNGGSIGYIWGGGNPPANVDTFSSGGSESFILLGDPASGSGAGSTPEPGTVTMLGGGLLVMAAYLRRKAR